MSTQKTFSIIKPDAVRRKLVGAIISKLELSGLEINFMYKLQMTRSEAEQFYAEHSQRPFFGELVDFMTSGPVVVMELEGTNAIEAYRTLMGSTDPAEADEGTIRKEFAESKGENCVHGSDSEQSAHIELTFLEDLVNSRHIPSCCG